MKSLTRGLIISLAAAGSVAMAPAASAEAVPLDGGAVPCSLTATPFRGAESGFGRGDRARIKVAFSLVSNTGGDGRNVWRVEINQNGKPLVSAKRRTHHGVIRLVRNARDTYRADVFTATAVNFWTGQRCGARAVVPGIRL